MVFGGTRGLPASVDDAVFADPEGVSGPHGDDYPLTGREARSAQCSNSRNRTPMPPHPVSAVPVSTTGMQVHVLRVVRLLVDRIAVAILAVMKPDACVVAALQPGWRPRVLAPPVRGPLGAAHVVEPDPLRFNDFFRSVRENANYRFVRERGHADVLGKDHPAGRVILIYQLAGELRRDVGHLLFVRRIGVIGAVVDKGAVEAVVAHRAPFTLSLSLEVHLQPAPAGCREGFIVVDDKAQFAIGDRLHRLHRLHHPRRALPRRRPRTVAVGIRRPHLHVVFRVTGPAAEGAGASRRDSLAGIDRLSPEGGVWTGPLDALLDAWTRPAGYEWRYDEDREEIEIVRRRSVAFSIHALAGRQRYAASASTDDGAEGGEEGGAVTTSQSIASETDYDPWPEIEAQTRALAGPGAVVAAAPSSASLVVTGTPGDVARVRAFLSWLNREVLRPVTLSVHVYSVRREREADYGIGIAAAVAELFGSSAELAVSPESIALIRPSAAVGDTLSATVRALSRAGTVSRVLSADIPSLNGKPAQFFELFNEAYLKESRTTAGDGIAQTELVPGTVLFRTLFDDGFPGLFHAIAARISDIIRSLPERRAGAHSV